MYAEWGRLPATTSSLGCGATRQDTTLTARQKINASNTWNFALIDYFADMSLLRHSDGSTGINFQKASVTLDGCVKIWTLRVDSVAAETTKLMNGLSGANANLEEGEEEEEDGEEEDGAGKGGKKKPKRVRRRCWTNRR